MVLLVKTRAALRPILESAVLEASEELAAGACDKLHGTSIPPHDWPGACLDLADLCVVMRKIVDECLLDIFQSNHKQGPIHHVPPEVLASIFSWVFTGERPGLSLVCRRWRSALQENPQIWSYVDYDRSYGAPDALERMLGFSAASPLHLDIQIDEASYEKSAAALSTNMYRCVSLRLVLSMSLSATASRAVTTMLSKPAPRMRYFRIFDVEGHFNGDRDSTPAPLFGNHAPQLEVVKLQCRSTALVSSAETMRQVQKLLWSPVSNEALQREDITRIITLCPELLQVGFDYEFWGGQEDSELPPLDLPPNLRSLVIVPNMVDANPQRLLRAVRADRISQVMIVHSADAVDDLDDSLLRALYAVPLTFSSTGTQSSPGAFVARTMTIEDPGTARRSIRVNMLPTEQDPFLFVRSDWTAPDEFRLWPDMRRSVWDLGHRSRLAPECFTHVRRLMIPEALFDSNVLDSEEGIPELPELEQLTVYLMAPGEHIESAKQLVSGLVSATLSPVPIEQEQRLLRCPRLGTVRLAVDVVLTRDRGVHVEPCTITAFIRRHLRYETPQLETIFLNGIQLYVVEPADLEEMYQLARETVYDERHITWKFKRPEVMNWG